MAANVRALSVADLQYSSTPASRPSSVPLALVPQQPAKSVVESNKKISSVSYPSFSSRPGRSGVHVDC
jgi:hypothetical protein